ncbi:zincin-like metallopeptidase domain-containing protein [Caldifermentibacillus hisashii]|uniref:ArdC family protein n=1 Tax=Caldifermentibacillus hisashii TaxID=996558 RepID=UPI002E208AF1|nr:zincin-like metallopeptidase domain-containing protein [Caldifermentibacillus hisashii]
MSQKIYEMVTERIIEKLEQGVVPWKRPFIKHPAVNWRTQKPYKGVNRLLLDGGEYATFKQIKEAGGKVKSGEKAQIVIFWKWIEIENEEGEIKKFPLLRYYSVFEINTQCEGLESKRMDTFEHEPLEKCEEIVKGYENAPEIRHVSGRAYYRPADDIINVPGMKDFEKVEEYYSTLFHEMIHSTGHESRLNRSGVRDLSENPFGSEIYSKEELVAEIGASMLCGIAGIENNTIDNSANYIQSWLEKLKNDKKLIVHASQQAEKACNYILGKGDLEDED